MRKVLPLSRALFATTLLTAVRAEEPKKEPPVKTPTFTVPKEWKALDPGKSGIVAAKFQSGEGENLVAVTLTGLAGDGGGLAPNVNRWRGQVGLEALNETDAVNSLLAAKVDGLPGHLLDLTGPEAVEGKVTQRVVIVLVRKGEQTWYVRMTGPAKAVGKQKAAFDAFVKSIRFEK